MQRNRVLRKGQFSIRKKVYGLEKNVLYWKHRKQVLSIRPIQREMERRNRYRERIRVNQDEEKFNNEEKTFNWNPYAAV